MTPFDIPELAYHRSVNVPTLRRLLGREQRTCTWCGASLIGTRRISWCSDACWNEYRQRWDAQQIRSMAFHRDKGVCAGCGCDCEYWQKKYQQLKKGWANADLTQLCEKYRPDENHKWDAAYRKNKRGRKNLRRMTRYQKNKKAIKALGHWEADHIVPVIRGGAMIGLTNIRTLCGRCHKKETAALAAMRAEERKLKLPQPVVKTPMHRQLSMID